MGRDKKIKLIRENQEIGEILLLCAFSIEEYQSSYLIYAKEDTPQNFNNIVYFGKILNKDNIDYLVSINNEPELNVIKNKIKELFKYSSELENIKQEKSDLSKKIKLPDNIFSATNSTTILNRETKNSDKYEEIKEQEKLKDNREYRSRLKDLYNNLNDLKPIDKTIPNTLYLNYYNEMGMILKSKLSTLKQLWIEYQLLYNEKNKKVEPKTPKIEIIEPLIENKEHISKTKINKSIEKSYNSVEKIDTHDNISSNFDELFNSLSKRIEYINDYLDELRELKEDTKNAKDEDLDISIERKQLDREKKAFEEYRKQEKEKLTNQKEELQIHFNKFQTLVERFDQKIKEVK